MALASNLDIQAWLAEDKIDVTDALAAKPNIEARRTIFGQLSGVFTAVTLHSWTTPDATPEIIRGIAGRLAAAQIYAVRYSSEDVAVPGYAQWLYDQAIMLLQGIRTGATVVVDSNQDPIGDAVAVLSFFPDDTTLPVFTMGKVFG